MTITSLTAGDLAAVPDAAVAVIRAARRVLTVCHENPEADALGSALAHALLVEALGGTGWPICADAVPPMYDFMPGLSRFRRAPDPDVAYDLIIVGDCGDLQRIGPILRDHAELFGRVPILDIDHHKSNPGFGAVDWIDPSAAATCEMTTLLAARLGVPLEAAGGQLAASLMAGLVIDTATFQHPSTTPRTLRVAAELVAAGAPLYDTSRRLYRTKPNRQLKLFGLALARLDSAVGGRLVWSRLEDADLAATGSDAADSEGLIDLLSQSASADIVILFKEAGHQTRLSIRTRDGGVDATELAGTWGGGGHARAAGATVAAPLAEAQAIVLPVAERLIAGHAPA
ncbi:MAG TPA: DHH family phosphoesterase [Candidatus Baltobacteraceae bacterium]|nr:DHH family phosphoesterase [Candidatus Baltobacteraceae bacterium]